MNEGKQEAQQPLILRCHRLMEAFAKSDDERSFYINKLEGFLLYVDLDKSQEELDILEQELKQNTDKYCLIPKLSFYETKKIMESFVNEKVYDIDTKEKLLDIIQSKEARENFIEFIYDHHTEQEKWHQFYQERFRIRIIEWLRQNHFHFVFEEDLDISSSLIEKLKQSLFQVKVSKEIANARKVLVAKAKIYYSNEALNPRPKRGRPPKQAVKAEIEAPLTMDIYFNLAANLRPFLFAPELNTSPNFSLFSTKFDANSPFALKQSMDDKEASLHEKLASFKALSQKKWNAQSSLLYDDIPSFDEIDDENEDDDEDEDDTLSVRKKTKAKKSLSKQKNKKTSPKKEKSKIKSSKK